MLRAELVTRTYQLKVTSVPSPVGSFRKSVSSTPVRSPVTTSRSLLSGSTSVYTQWIRNGGARRATSGACWTLKDTVLPTPSSSSPATSISSMEGHHRRTALRDVTTSKTGGSSAG